MHGNPVRGSEQVGAGGKDGFGGKEKKDKRAKGRLQGKANNPKPSCLKKPSIQTPSIHPSIQAHKLTFMMAGQLLGDGMEQKAACCPDENCGPQALELVLRHEKPLSVLQYPDSSFVQLLASPP